MSKARNVRWSDDLGQFLDDCVETSEKNGASLSFSAIAHIYALAGVDVAQRAQKGDPEASKIWNQAIAEVMGLQKAEKSKHAKNIWANRRANASQLEADRAELAAVDKAHEEADKRKTRKRGDVAAASPGVIPEPKTDSKEKGKKTKDNA
jgi:hypothetical protein